MMSRKIVKEYLKYHFNRDADAELEETCGECEACGCCGDNRGELGEDDDTTPEEIECGVVEHGAKLE
jgi:hypothetical protein